MNSLLNKSKIYFRLDAGGLIGQGHLSRCKNLAIAFSELGHECIFVIRKRAFLSLPTFPFKIIWLKEPEGNVTENVSSWISGNEEIEANEFLSVVDSGNIVVVDHYGLNSIWHEEIKKSNQMVIALQDIPSTDIKADILLNYNIGAEKLYDELETSIIKYLGPQFAPLDAQYSLNRKHYKKDNTFNTVGVSLGGVRKELLEKIIYAVNELEELKTKKINWLVNNDEERELIQNVLIGFNINFYSKLPDLAEFYKYADVVIGACGISFLERAILGKWQIVFKVANNQTNIVESIISGKLGFFAGDLQILPKEKVVAIMRQLLNLPSKEIEVVTKKAFSITDGLGAKKFAICIEDLENK